MSRTLIVVDMQDEFIPATNPDCQAVVLDEIRRARERQDWIFLLALEGRGPILRCIQYAVDGYELSLELVKSGVSGVQKIREGMLLKYLHDTNFIVCGVYTSICVAVTALDLAIQNAHRTVTVVSDACWDSGMDSHQRGLNSIREHAERYPNLMVSYSESWSPAMSVCPSG